MENVKLELAFCEDCAWREYASSASEALTVHRLHNCPFRYRPQKKRAAEAEEDITREPIAFVRFVRSFFVNDSSGHAQYLVRLADLTIQQYEDMEAKL